MQFPPSQASPAQSPFNTTTTIITKENTRTTLSVLLATSVFSFLFIFSLSSTNSSTNTAPQYPRPDHYLFPTRKPTLNKIPSDPAPSSVAYLLSGSAGDSGRILRLLYATYHPKNFYVLHLDRFASQTERDSLAVTVQSVPIFRAAQNVNVIGKADYAYPKGSSSISATLHGASILLRTSANWEWFIPLSAGDYPLITQDDLLHILSYLPKDMNFVNHTSYIGWRESRKLKPIIVDPGLYLSEKTQMFYATQKRELPHAFRLFSGSSLAILSHNFVEFCIMGTDNLPRILLMYLSNTPSSLPNYFPTILCNSRQFNRTIVNDNLLYVAQDEPFRKELHSLNSTEFDVMVQSGAAFARDSHFDDSVFDRIDREILGRSPGKVVPGGWCLGEPEENICAVWGDADILRPGPGAGRLETRIVQLLSNGEFRSQQCVVE